MMKINKKLFWALAALCLVTFIAHLCFYPALPETIPTHWGVDGAVNGTGPKAVALLLAALPAVMLVLFRFLPAMDPKSESYDKFKPIWSGFVTAIVVFLAAVSFITELSVFGLLPEKGNFVSVIIGGGIGLLFIILGNYMPRIKQNYSFGCKTPWALADEHNWNRTQRMGGITFVLIGVLMIISAILGGIIPGFITVFLPIIIIGGIAWLYAYSFLVFKGIMK